MDGVWLARGLSLVATVAGLAACAGEGLPEPGSIVVSARPDEESAYGWQLFVADGDGGNLRRLTHKDGDSSPDWSPDGTRLAFNRQPEAECPRIACDQIWTTDANGNDPRPVTPADQRNEGPQWSPDGESIAFVHWKDDPDGIRIIETSIEVVAADGSGGRVIADGLGEDTGSSWSPDGTRIAFFSDREDKKDEGRFFTYVVDGGAERRLTDIFKSEDGFSWSPDSKQIVVAGDRGDGNNDLFVLNVDDGTLERRLTRTPEDETGPMWSPDGGSIEFERGEFLEKSAIVVLDLDDGSERSLSPSAEYDVAETWSPDGKHLAFTRGSLGSETLWMMNADGTNAHEIKGPFTEPSLGIDWAPAPPKDE